MEGLCERPRKLIHRELRSQLLDTVTYSRNTHKARSSRLIPLPTDIKETHEPLNAVQGLTISAELTC